MSRSSDKAMRALVFGVSGMTWRVADPLLAAGKMPHLKQLIDSGVRGTLHSVRAPDDKHFRPQIAWMSVATGCLPEHHGVTRFFHTADDLRRPYFWDAFQNAGQSVGLFGWPMTWPPRPVNGFLIPCYHSRDDRTWPPELKSVKWLERQRQEARDGREADGQIGRSGALSIARSLRHQGIVIRTAPRLLRAGMRLKMTHDPEKRALILRHAKSHVSVDMFLKLCREYRPGLASFHTFLADFVSHRYWRYHEPQLFASAPASERVLRDAVEDAYICTDQMLGRILRRVPEDAVVAVISEHGMAPEPESAEAGDWQYTIRGNQLASLVGLGDELLSCPIARWIAYRNRSGGAVPTDAAARFRATRIVETGLPLFQVHEHGADEVIVKFSIDPANERYREGDLDRLTVEFENQRFPFTQIAVRAGRQRSAMHDGQGVIVMRGPGIRPGAQVDDGRVIDFAPTLLRAVGLEFPGACDGRALDVFEGLR